MSKVCLIDGSGYIFRAFYALPPMNTPDGTPVNAVYGFVTMFMRLIKNINCDYCVVLFDAKRNNFRNEIFKDYKANRAEIPEQLIPQFSLIHQAVKAMNLAYVLQEGYEADDLIATYAKQAVENGDEAIIVSSDKDLMQLIRDGVTFYDGMKDKFFTAADVKEKFGVYPPQVVDVQALAGDKTDNIPGVPGIGLKTAAELINQFGSLQQVLDNAESIKQNKRREIICQNRQSAEISLRLVTLKNDVPVEHSLAEFKCLPPDAETLLAFTDNLGFKSIHSKLEKWVAERCGVLPNAKSALSDLPKQYQKIHDKAALIDLYNKIKSGGRVCFQVLHNGVFPEAISMTTEENSAYYLLLPQESENSDLFLREEAGRLGSETVKNFLISVFDNSDILKIGLDLKRQWHLLNQICHKSLNLFPYDDVELMSYVLDSSEHAHSLKELSKLFLDLEIAEPKTTPKLKKIDFFAEEYGDYAFAVSDYILRLYKLFKDRLFQEHATFVYEMLDRRLLQILLQMEDAGIMIDDTRLAKLDTEFTAQLNKIEREIYNLAGEEFNLSSPKQIGEILFGKLGLSGAKKTPSGNYNTGAEVLEQLAEEYDIAAKILEWRTYAKLKSTYTQTLLEVKDSHNRVHTTFSQTVVNTGRLASSNPNLQNIPNRTEIGRQIRECFVAKSGYKIVAADYSQMELRLLASVADVKALKEAFAQGTDIHAATAAKVFNIPYAEVDREHRNRAKAINFGIVYGISQFGLAKQIGTSKELAKQYIDSYFNIMPEVKTYMDKTIDFARRHGYVLTPLNRKCTIFGINDKNHRTASFAERAAINAPIQGGAADIVKLAMQQAVKAVKEQNLQAQLLLQVHDELIFEVRQEQAAKLADLLKNIMENVADTAVKMAVEVGIGDDWSDAH